MTPYDEMRARCQHYATVFERAAEAQRLASHLAQAGMLAQYAIKLRYIAEEEPVVADDFNEHSGRE